jgi:thiol-disulfide isomerase/thioredoxin
MIDSSKSMGSWAYRIATLAILAGAALTMVSWLKLCSELCNEAHHYQLFGVPFEISGGFYFISLAIAHFLGRRNSSHRFLAEMLIAGGFGAEGAFILLQKVQIRAWCPVCLSIAITIGITAICYLFFIRDNQGEKKMKAWVQISALSAVLLFGFTASFLGVTKIDRLQAVEDAIKETIKFGNLQSPIEIYVFTDWACPACRAIEPSLEAMAPRLAKQAQLTFVDTVIHPETLNYAPYNLSFMAYNKPQYFKIRESLGKLSVKNKKPTDEEIAQVAASLGVRYRELPYQDISTAMHYFEDLVDKFKITGTPTIAIVNRDLKKGKKLAGMEEITESNVMKAIDSLR